jgi:uncharacterized protein YwqG
MLALVRNLFGKLFNKPLNKALMRDVAALVAPLAKPCIHLVKGAAPSLSHFGGSPSLPPDVAWPEKNGIKLGFLARLSLSAIAQVHSVDWLPQAGALLFFYDMEQQDWGFDPKHRGSWAVLLVPDLVTPMKQQDDTGINAESPLPHRNIAFRCIDTLPSWEKDSVRQLDLSSQESDEFFRLADAPYEATPKHQVTGFPMPIQADDMELECQLVSNGQFCGDPSGYKGPRALSLKPGAANWRLLFQIDTDDDLDMMWGDAGMLYFWVQEHEAKAANFTNTWLVLQCG